MADNLNFSNLIFVIFSFCSFLCSNARHARIIATNIQMILLQEIQMSDQSVSIVCLIDVSSEKITSDF